MIPATFSYLRVGLAAVTIPVSAHPRSQTQNELGSLCVVYQSWNGLRHHEHKVLKLLVIHHIFLLCHLPHGSGQKLQRRQKEAQR